MALILTKIEFFKDKTASALEDVYPKGTLPKIPKPKACYTGTDNPKTMPVPQAFCQGAARAYMERLTLCYEGICLRAERVTPRGPCRAKGSNGPGAAGRQHIIPYYPPQTERPTW
ncbi:hypothetical protein KL86DES1_22103 [uncultured Desulfovibrio sp.]|uniref:Uncharacterized protein n=1 Tax=uncultured Desulfovibrio sp. TaxID=167968 RepID=A0A212LAU8_9BACT|nr:hypothetical protein KL86DES1_22103 [uncultured Desulfovibrio sp.]VZH34997.1 conserved protein of unknown function [Desulfovibrio sp. 86]